MSNAYQLNYDDGFFQGSSSNQQYPNMNQQQQQQQPHSQNSPFYDPSSFYGQQNSNSFYNPTSFAQNDYYVPQTLNQVDGPMSANAALPNSFEQEPPLLEELGINFSHIFDKTMCVLNPFRQPPQSIIHDTDLAGPLVFCVAYGFSLLLLGKIQFGYVYGITALGCLSMYSLLNLMSDNGVSAICISSTLGYCLLPMVILSFLAQIILLKSFHGLILSLLFVLWCSMSSSKLFVNALNMNNQQALVLYPCLLLYGIFALLNIF